jgi:hypothetical protein
MREGSIVGDYKPSGDLNISRQAPKENHWMMVVLFDLW